MSDKKEDTIKLNSNIQYFSDITLLCKTTQKNKLIIFILFEFNKEYFKIILCNISLIYNENKETFLIILLFILN